MITTLIVIGLILVSAILIYHEVPFQKISITLSLLTLITSLVGTLPIFIPILIITLTVIGNVTHLRQTWLTQPLFRQFKTQLPTMSKTEKEALAAGTVWWEAELFQGKPNWATLHDIPKPQLTTEETEFLNGPVNVLCRMTNDFEITHTYADLPPEIWQYLKDEKFFAMNITKKYGGLEFSAHAQSLVLKKLAGMSMLLASTVGVPNSLGPGELLHHYGTRKQKDHYLPRLAEGTEIPCFALTSPEAGSDAGSIPDLGIVAYDMWKGERTLGMYLTWNKRYITLAPIATVLGLAFQLRDPEHLLGNKTHLGMTCALIPTHLDGIEIGRRHFPLNIPFQNGPTRAKSLFVPLDFIIGGPKMAGQGWRMLVECLSIGRGITLPANATGGAKMTALATGAYARIRRQFKLPIGKMEGIEAPLARLAGRAYMMEAASQLAVTGIDLGEKPSVLSAIVKYHCTHLGQQCTLDAMDVVGGKGICLGERNFTARGYQGAPIAVTVEGANILTRSMIIFGQGAIRCHPYVLNEMAAVQEADTTVGLHKFDRIIYDHIGFTLRNALRSIWFGLTQARFSQTPYHNAHHHQQLNRDSANLALLADITMAILGGKLKRKERLSARLGDLLSLLYLNSATLKRFHDDGHPQADQPLIDWVLRNNHHQTQQTLQKILSNYPNRLIARILKWCLFPLGMPHSTPTEDSLDQKCAQLLQTPNETRDRIGQGQFLEPIKGCPMGLLESALRDILQAEPIFDRINQQREKPHPFMNLDQLAQEALQRTWITTEEAQILIRAEHCRLQSIKVDDFDPNALAQASQHNPNINSAA